MRHVIRLFLVLSVVRVASDACYDAYLQCTATASVAINLLTIANFGSINAWLDGKVSQFMALNPSVTITVHEVPWGEVRAEALKDASDGVHYYHAYFMMVGQALGEMAPFLYDMTDLIVRNVNGVNWHEIGQFFRTSQALYQGKVLVLPLDGDFLSLFYRLDYFAAHNMSAPRTLEEYVAASIYFNGKDLDGDGELDYGSCFPHHGWASHYYFWAWVAPFTQYLGTAQGVFFDVDTLEPLVDNPAVQEAVRLWKQVAGPPEWGDGSTNGQPRGTNSTMDLWLQGRCAMTLEWEQAYIALDTADNISVGSAVHPGSERVWSRDGNEVITCDQSSCPHATVYPDKVVNHAPYNAFNGWSGAINGGTDSARQAAAFNFLSFLMNDGKVEAFLVEGAVSFVKPKNLVPDIFFEYGWQEPAVTLYCNAMTQNIESANAALELRLPNNDEYFSAAKGPLVQYWNNTGEYADVSDEEGAILVTRAMKTAMQQVTDVGDLATAVANYQKELSVYVEPEEQASSDHPLLPEWVLFGGLAFLGSLIVVIVVFAAVRWVYVTYRQKQQLKQRQQRAWEQLIDEAEVSASLLGCPMSLVSAENFLSAGRLVNLEDLRDLGKVRVLDTLEKVYRFQEAHFIVFLSHQWISWGEADPDGVHYSTMCAAVRQCAEQLHTDLGAMYIWVDVCSIAQEHRAMQELAISSLPLYSAVCDMFVVISPSVVHQDTGRLCDTASYSRRGWCRAEMIAKVLSTGTDNMFICDSLSGPLRDVTEDILNDLDLHVFEGEFSCCTLKHRQSPRCDKEALRRPLLGIYCHYLKKSRCLEERTNSVTVAMNFFSKDKERMFPTHFQFTTEGKGSVMHEETRELFGPLVQMMEQRVASRVDEGERIVNVWHTGRLSRRETLGEGCEFTIRDI